MKSVMRHQFSQVPSAQIPRSSFDRSHGLKTTFDAGWLVPIFIDEALPGDTFNLNMTGFARLATPIHPIMDNMFMETFFFAVPKRLVWDNWQKFNGEQENPGDSTDFLVPQQTTTNVPGSLSDYFGLPTNATNVTASQLPFRAYNLIWNEWFRDQNLQQSLPVPKGDDGTTIINSIQKRGKRHDYFTSCLPWPQKGDAVKLPLGDAAPVKGIGKQRTVANFPQSSVAVIESGPDFTGQNATYTNATRLDEATEGFNYIQGSAGIDGWPVIYADLSNATAATINELRQAFQIQRMQERDARGGTRYTEIIRSHFGVVSPDARLQRPEFLGGGHSYVNINPVAQTSETNVSGPDTSPQGNLAAYGTSTLQGHGFTKSFTEHCIIIGLVNVRADLTYQQCVERMWSRRTRYDFYWPALAQIGEQAVLNQELHFSADPAVNAATFGYQERYAEYRYKPSRITGRFRSTDPETLDPWHLSQTFADTPVLNDEFIEDDPPIDRVIAVVDEPHFLFDSYFNFRCARPMPTYGVPGMIDHF